MLKRQIPIALTIAFTYPLALPAFADGIWQGSYSANGQCFCTGEQPASLASQIVPTPIGGQSIKQVCARVGEGPELKKQSGLFNHPVYEDPQCGHGPHAASSQVRDTACIGTFDEGFDSCEPLGPKWDLNQAYDVPVKIAAALPADPASTDRSDFTSLERRSSLESGGDVAKEATEAAANSPEEREAALAAFSGKSVTLDGQRYLQARNDMDPQGGEVGSRIILDGVVYLKDDDSLLVADLHKGGKSSVDAQAKSEPATVAERNIIKQATAQATTTSDRASSSAAEEPAKQLAQSEEQQAQREAQARADYEKEQQARTARLLERRKDAREQNRVEELRLAEEQRVAAQKDLTDKRKIAAEKRLAEQKVAAERRKLAEEQRLATQKNAAEKSKLAEEQRLATQKDADEKLIREQKLAEKKRLSEQALAEKKADRESKGAAVAEASRQVDSAGGDSSSVTKAAVLSALRLPSGVRASSREFRYMEAMPVTYDIGGAGIMLEGSGQASSRFQWLGRLGVAETYREVMIGGGYYFTPANATRMTFVVLAGLENGSFELSDEERAPGLTVNSADSGVFLGALSRLVINSKFELKAGLGYSSFFEGDATVFGGGYYHLTPRLDILSRFEVGDNDALGIGIRYYY